jgi:CBS domain-containing protein
MDADSTTTVRDSHDTHDLRPSGEATIQQAADRMIKGRIRRRFVTRDEKIVGVITSLDMLRVVRDL